MKRYIKAGEDSYRQINDISELEDLVEQGYDSWRQGLTKIDYEICRYLDESRKYNNEYIYLYYPDVMVQENFIDELRRLGEDYVVANTATAVSILLSYGCKLEPTMVDIQKGSSKEPMFLIRL